MKLTPEQLRQTADAIEAFNAGDAVEFQAEGGEWCPTQMPTCAWNFTSDKGYRPASKAEPPKPWDMNTCPALPFEILRKDKQLRTIVDFAEISRVGIGFGYMVTYQELLDGYTLTNGSPCGVTP